MLKSVLATDGSSLPHPMIVRVYPRPCCTWQSSRDSLVYHITGLKASGGSTCANPNLNFYIFAVSFRIFLSPSFFHTFILAMFRFLPFAALVSLITHSFATPVPNQDEKLADAAYDYVVVGGGM